MPSKQHQHAGHRMGQRGVTRPNHGHHDHEHPENEESDPAKSGDSSERGQGGHSGSDHGGHEMSREERLDLLTQHHRQTLWIYWTLILLGIWVALSPFTFSYGKALVEPSSGREVWLSLQARASAMVWSDVISGVLLIFFGGRSLRPNRPISLWACCLVGIWLNMAPLLLWSPSAAAYLNGTLVGAWVIALSVLIPGMPNMILYMKMGAPTPPGWSYNPSSWPQRWIMIVTGFAGWQVSRYLAAHQLGYIDHAWDPFFGTGTRDVLNSKMSHQWPISDAALGTFAYTFEFLMGWMGSPARWRTMPWMVTLFGILVIPLGLVHIILVISQPLVVGQWCTLCLLAASIMLPMIPLETDEVIAMGQHLVQARRRGENFWRVFWKGGEPEGCSPDERSPELAEFSERPGRVFKASIWGLSFPWTLVASAALGLLLMFAPAVFGTAKPAAHVDHLLGALIVTVSVICMGEVVRAGRFLNVGLGLAVAVLPWFLSGASTAGRVLDLAAGLLVVVLAFPRGPVRERYGSWDRFIV